MSGPQSSTIYVPLSSEEPETTEIINKLAKSSQAVMTIKVMS